MYIRYASSYSGLFGYTSNATITNVILENVDIQNTSSATGGLVGECATSTITKCAVIGGMVKGSSMVGGLIGNLVSSSVTDCYTTCDVGITSGTNTDIGTFMGRNTTAGENYRCFATGKRYDANNNVVTSGAYCNWFSLINQSDLYWDMESSLATNKSTSATGLTGKTTAEMKTQSTFTNYDFDTIWQINDGEYPTLRAPFITE